MSERVFYKDLKGYSKKSIEILAEYLNVPSHLSIDEKTRAIAKSLSTKMKDREQ